MYFNKANQISSAFFLLSASLVFAGEAPSTPPRKRQRPDVMFVTPPKPQKPRRERESFAVFLSDKCKINNFSAWWNSLSQADKQSYATKKDEWGKGILHHLAWNKNPRMLDVADAFPGQLTVENGEGALPCEYFSVSDGNLANASGYESEVLQKTHKAYSDSLSDSVGVPPVVSKLIASMVVGDLGAGYRA